MAGQLKVLNQSQCHSKGKSISSLAIWYNFPFNQKIKPAKLDCLGEIDLFLWCTSTSWGFNLILEWRWLFFQYYFKWVHNNQPLLLRTSTKKLIIDQQLHRYHRNCDEWLEYPWKSRLINWNFLCDCFLIWGHPKIFFSI